MSHTSSLAMHYDRAMDITDTRYVVTWNLKAETEIRAETPEEAEKMMRAQMGWMMWREFDTKTISFEIQGVTPGEYTE